MFYVKQLAPGIARTCNPVIRSHRAPLLWLCSKETVERARAQGEPRTQGEKGDPGERDEPGPATVPSEFMLKRTRKVATIWPQLFQFEPPSLT